MNKLHRQAIELKYEGKTYQEISEALDGKFTKSTLDTYFAVDGMLYMPYLEYCAKQERLREKEAQAIFKKEVTNAAKAVMAVLGNALQKKDDRLTLDAANIILDRAGLVVVRKSEVKDNARGEEEYTPDELRQQLRDSGVDPDTIRYISAAPVRKERPVRA